jgi:hypothetical protein
VMATIALWTTMPSAATVGIGSRGQLPLDA